MLMLCVLTANMAFASDINDTAILNEDVSDELAVMDEDNILSESPKTFADLNEDINGNQESEVNLSCDYSFSSADENFTQGILISRNVTVDGNGHTLNANNGARIFRIADSSLNVVLKNLIFANGSASSGGAISGKCVVINCSFENNSANSGGAIYGASAIGCTFKNNSARDGGAIFLDSVNLKIEGCIFEGNSAAEQAGAVCIKAATYVNVTNCTFKSNRAKSGGAMSVVYSNDVCLFDSTFTGNLATLNGGAINYDFAIGNIVDNCSFENNTAYQNGGAFTWIYSNGNITESRFKRNAADGNGGAIFINIPNTSSMIHQQLLTDCNFTDNRAQNGGAIYNNDYYKITESTFYFFNNSAQENGGAVYCNDSWSFTDSSFIANSAENGGALYGRDYCKFFASSFIANTAQENGSAVYCRDYGYFFDNVFNNNSALSTGGAIYSGSHSSFYKTDFINNSAENAGAVFCHDYGTFYNLKFNQNSAIKFGGAVMCSNYCKFYTSNFTNNSADGGSAIYTESAFNSISDSVFMLNKANPSFETSNKYLIITFTLSGKNNFLNAIYSWFDFEYSNITYWNGTVTNTGLMPPVKNSCPGLDFTVEIYDSDNNLINRTNQKTDAHGKIILDYYSFEIGKYSCRIYHEDDDYCSPCSQSFNFTVGEFAKLERILHFTQDNGIVNLTQNYTYSIGYDTLDTIYVEYDNLTINGNGYTIDALDQLTELAVSRRNSISIFNCTFANDIFLRCVDGNSAFIHDCSFKGNPTSIVCSRFDGVQISNCSFENSSNNYGGAIYLEENGNAVINGCNFSQNQAYSGGAIYIEDNSFSTIMDCTFKSNMASSGGAITANMINNIDLVNCSFFNNSALDGGALYFMADWDNVTVDYCIFINNSASYEGAAIEWTGRNNVLRNSIFLSNKAPSEQIYGRMLDDSQIIITFTGSNNFINAISTVMEPVCENVTYWDGTVTNTDIRQPVFESCPGQNITIRIFDHNNVLIKEIIEKTDERGRLVFVLSSLPPASSQIRFSHEDDEYYTRSSAATFNVTAVGDFETLQNLINNASDNGVINLTRNYTFIPGLDNGNYIEINKNNLTINGNGFVIDGLNQSRMFAITAENVTLTNITFMNGANRQTLIDIWEIAANCIIDGCSFINNDVGLNYEVISVDSHDFTLKNSNFINNTGFAVRFFDCLNASVSNSTFINNTNAISSFDCMEYCIISNCSFEGNSNPLSDGGAVNLNSELAIVENCNFTNNSVSYNAGALYLEGVNSIVSNCIFTGNTAGDNYGGAMDARVQYINITGCSFFNNTANMGGAILIRDHRMCTIDSSVFKFNSANEGAAIILEGRAILTNSTLLSNKAHSQSLSLEGIGEDIVIGFAGHNNYINAVYTYSDFEMHNVVYWNGKVVNSDEENPSQNSFAGQDITLEIYDSQDNLVENITLTTDDENRIYYNIINLEDGNYSFIAYHADDEYYAYIGCNGTFEQNRNSSCVSINISDRAEFHYPDCNITFTIINKTTSRVVITNVDGTVVYVNRTIDEDYIIVDLDPNEDYYNITITNSPTADYGPSHDSKLFKILKANSSVSIHNIEDVYCGNAVNVEFDVENLTTLNVTVVDGNNVCLFNVTTTNMSVVIQALPVGSYNITVINNGDKYHSTSFDSAIFNVVKFNSSVSIHYIPDITYGNVVKVEFDVENMTTLNVTVFDANNVVVFNVTTANSSVAISYLPVGTYHITVTNSEDEYISESSDSAIFNVVRANSSVSIHSIPDVGYGSAVNVGFDVENMTTLNVTVFDANNEIVFNVTTTNASVIIHVLPVGTYNITVVNEGDDHYNGSADSLIFNVIRTLNNVKVLVEDVVYGMNATIIVNADIDGLYHVYVNGTDNVVNVANGKGNISLRLDVGSYYANATFNNSNYNSIIANATFRVLSNSDYDIIINTNSTLVGENATVIVNLPKYCKGNVTVRIGDENYTANVTDGSASITIPNLKAGYNNATLIYSGDEIYASKQSNFTIRVKKVSVSAYDVKYGWAKKVTYSAKLIDGDGNPVSNRQVMFSIDGKSYKSTTNGNGVASVSVALKIGNHNVKVSSPYGTVTKKITVVSRFSANKNIRMFYFDGTKYSVKVYADNGKPVGAKQVVKVKLNKKTYKLKTNKKGVASLTIPKTVKPGKYAITATYKGQTIKNVINVKKILASKKTVKVKRTAKKLILKAKLKKKLKGKKITFKFKGKKYTAKTNKKGIAKVKINKKVIKKLKRGKKYKLKIIYFKTSINAKVKVMK